MISFTQQPRYVDPTQFNVGSTSKTLAKHWLNISCCCVPRWHTWDFIRFITHAGPSHLGRGPWPIKIRGEDHRQWRHWSRKKHGDTIFGLAVIPILLYSLVLDITPTCLRWCLAVSFIMFSWCFCCCCITNCWWAQSSWPGSGSGAEWVRLSGGLLKVK